MYGMDRMNTCETSTPAGEINESKTVEYLKKL